MIPSHETKMAHFGRFSPEGGAHQRGHATTRVLQGFFEGSLKEVLRRRVLRRCLVRVS